MEGKVNWANDWESRISKLADDGKLKFLDNGEVDIVNDKQEQSFLQESRKKEKLLSKQIDPVLPTMGAAPQFSLFFIC